MKTQIDRQKIISEIIKAAKSYKQNLVGKTFLYVFDNKHIEVMFKAKDFRHLTGVDTALSAQDFYKKARQGKLQASQIFFSARHPYSLAQKKLKHLQDISSLAMGESFMLKDVNTQTESYKYGTTDLEFSLCFNKEYDINGIEQGDCFIAKSLRDEDCFSKSKGVFTITHIYSKANDEKKYNQELYCEQGFSVDDLPPEIQSMLSEDLFGAEQQSELTSSITGGTSKPTQMSITKDNVVPTNFRIQGNGVAVLPPAVLPNDLFTQLANALVNGLDSIVHKISMAFEKLNVAATKALNPLFAPEQPQKPPRASHSRSKGKSPAKAKTAEMARHAVPAKQSEQKQEKRSSVLADLKTIRTEQAQDKPERSHQRSKSNNREL